MSRFFTSQLGVGVCRRWCLPSPAPPAPPPALTRPWRACAQGLEERPGAHSGPSSPCCTPVPWRRARCTARVPWSILTMSATRCAGSARAQPGDPPAPSASGAAGRLPAWQAPRLRRVHLCGWRAVRGRVDRRQGARPGRLGVRERQPVRGGVGRWQDQWPGARAAACACA